MSHIAFQSRGSGRPVVLLHGFPMNHAVWHDFASQLATDFQVITPDLPGFGDSALLPAPFSLDQVARALLDWLSREKIDNSVLIGHSLGGYVALAMAEQSPAHFAGLGLFHSTALADAPEKKQSRTKVLEFIDHNGVEAFTANFIQPLFAHAEHPAIPAIRALNLQSTEAAVKGYTVAMRDRPDRTPVLQSFAKPVLMIGGEKDGGIPASSLQEQAKLPRQPHLYILPDTGHMGMFERPEETLKMVRDFVKIC